jgi:predicted dehydrogenase
MTGPNTQAGAPRIATAGTLPEELGRALADRFELVPEADDTDAPVALIGRLAEWTEDDLAKLADRVPGRMIIPALTRRFQPGVQRLAAAVVGGDLGLPWAVVSEQVVRRPVDEDQLSLLDLLADSVDAVRSILGLEVRSVAARASAPLEAHAGVVTATLIFDHDLGASITVGRIDGSPVGSPDDRIRVMGNEGVLLADLGRPAVLINGGVESRRYGPEALDGLLGQVGVAASGGRTQAPTLADARAVVRVLAAARRSVAENAVIDLGGS